MIVRIIAGAALVFGSTALVSAAVAQGAAPLADRAAPLTDGVADCSTVSASVRMQAVGYNHVVTLTNRCQRAVTCEVWTNVDPSPHYTLHAKPGESAEIITRVGSPSRDVQAGRVCHAG